MNKFNLEVLKRFWIIARLYWLGEEKWRALSLLGILLVLSLSSTVLGVIFNQKRGDIISALSAKSPDRFWESVVTYLLILVIYVPLVAGFAYIQNKLGLYWRRWLTQYMVSRYLSDRAFYQIGNFKTDIDNPDQRIAQDINNFCLGSLSFILIILSSTFDVIGYSTSLWQISKLLVLFLLLYALTITIATIWFFGKKLVRLNFEQLKKEANYRFSLVRLRENSESIAFYQGEIQEEQKLSEQFQEIFDNFNKLILWRDLNLGLFSNTVQFLPFVIPSIIVGMQVLSGETEVGKVTEAIGAFLSIFFSLNVIVSQFDFLTGFTAGIDRLYSFWEYMNLENQNIRRIDKPVIDTRESKEISIEHLTLYTPNYERVLVEDLSIKLLPRESLLIKGTSGCGKSSLLRAIGGLWTSGTGIIYRPPLKEILFLPQKPYMILGTLKQQLLYPGNDDNIANEEIYAALKNVNLEDLVERFGSLDAQQEWSEVLSLGEQQRIAFARILLNPPNYVILDESTSALDTNNEQKLYEYLRRIKITYISVGHRETLNNYHTKTLELFNSKQWELK